MPNVASSLCLAVCLALAGSADAAKDPPAVVPGSTTPGLTHAQLAKVAAELGPEIEGQDAEVALAKLKTVLGEPVLTYGDGWLQWAVTGTTRCARVVLTVFSDPAIAGGVAHLDHRVHEIGSKEFFSCVDAAHRDDPGTASRAASAATFEVHDEADDRRLKMLVIGGLLAVFVLLVGIVVWRFRANRNVWADFAKAHGLTASGLEVRGEPRVAGVYRGVRIEVGLGVVGSLRIRGMGRFKISDTRAVAMFATPLAADLWLTARELAGGRDVAPAARALLSEPATGPAVAAFLRRSRQGYIASDGVCASVAAMPSDVAALQRLVDACVDCVHAVDSARAGRHEPAGAGEEGAPQRLARDANRDAVGERLDRRFTTKSPESARDRDQY